MRCGIRDSAVKFGSGFMFGTPIDIRRARRAIAYARRTFWGRTASLFNLLPTALFRQHNSETPFGV